ncbi:50S ribosomal protein L11 methyltransferase [Sphingomonas sp. BGYR3]|uniref:50S ribosomal protein L11 methyltransferase n=1 Tax=Sphingomonas sp. BGYR3 TaxID=2975483 RepID=UPI0021A71B64|nr:50S ribosomal protein L11 methyltransferase [Sphingomonas sp. BGYR3]MDG5489086.1 50S ribosomal protein L11 methyltransferase [Sphingomonas sp. BGYR3]
MSAESWKLTLPCTRAEAEAIDADLGALAMLEPTPVLMTSESVEDDPDSWRIEAYFEGKPDKAAIAAVLAMAPSAAGAKPVLERLDDADWVTMSQSGIEPVQAGRFYVHTDTNKGNVPAGAVPFMIPAGLAFGTGTHETTSGCLMMLDDLKRAGARFRHVVDVGTGTGLLAFAAMHLWPTAQATASDIDPMSIEVTRDNALANGVALGRGKGTLALAVAPGLEHPMLIARAPYDLAIANILAGPLIDLAPTLCAAVAPGGTLILAGLLDTQAEAVIRAYRRQGMRLAGRIDRGQWPTLRLVRRHRFGADRTTRPGPRVPSPAPGFGSW